MNKYQSLFLNNLEKQLAEWHKRTDAVPYEEFYRFLHSIKGTSGTIELHDLMKIAASSLQQLERDSSTICSSEEVHRHLQELRQYMNCAHHELSISHESPSLTDKNGEAQPSILILDDDVPLLMILKEELQAAGWSVIATTSSHKAIEYFHDVSPDCLLLGLHIPETNGFEIIELLSEKLKKQYIPTTIMTHDCSRDIKLRAYRLGIDDVICKPIDMEDLLARLQRQMNGKRRLDRLLFVDELTGAFNRKFMHEALGRLFTESSRSGRGFSVAMLDLDRFKSINDTHGHLVGDQVLIQFTSFMKQQLRVSDMFIRYGGEEFIVVFPNTELQEAKRLLTEWIDQFAEVQFQVPNGKLCCTFSAGVVYVNQFTTRLHRWIEIADEALYRAKSLGRRRVATEEDLATKTAKRKLHICVVDDDPLMRMMLSELFSKPLDERLELELSLYSDGLTFVNELPQNVTSPYAVILDGLLPGMDGLEVLEYIQQLPQADQFTVIMLTGRSEEQDIVKALQLGADDYVTKPFRLKELEARVRRFIRRWV